MAAGLIGAVGAAPDVIARLEDKQELVAGAASATLYTMQCEEALAALLSCLLHATPRVLRGAVGSLARWSPPRRALQALSEAHLVGPRALAQHKVRSEARAAACEVLGHLAWGGASPAEDEDDLRHGEAAAPIPPDEAGRAAAYEALLPLLEAREEGVRVQAALALGRLARPHALRPLVPLVKDRSEKVVEAAVWAIEALDWSGFLESNERLVMAGPVLKKQEKFMGSVNTKQLLLTSAKRLFYVDAASHKSKECELRAEAVRGGGAAESAMNVWQNGKPQRVQCVTCTAARWIEAISTAAKAPTFDVSAVSSTIARTTSLRRAGESVLPDGTTPRRLESQTFSNNL